MEKLRNYVELIGIIQNPVKMFVNKSHREQVSVKLHVLDKVRDKGCYFSIYFFDNMARSLSLGEDMIDPVPATQGTQIWICGILVSFGMVDESSGYYVQRVGVEVEGLTIMRTAEEVEARKEARERESILA